MDENESDLCEEYQISYLEKLVAIAVIIVGLFVILSGLNGNLQISYIAFADFLSEFHNSIK